MRFLITLIAAFTCFVAGAQKVYIQREGNNNYINHTVIAGQNTYAIARSYFTTEDELNTLNGLKKSAIIAVGQVLKIPVTKNNFIAENAKEETGFQPLHYIVKKADNLYRLGLNFNTKSDVIQKINNKPNNVIGEGQELLIGYIKTTNAVILTTKKPEERIIELPDSSNAAEITVSGPIVTGEEEKPEEKKPEPKKAEEPYKQHKKEPVQDPLYTGVYEPGFFAAHFPERGDANARKKIALKAGTFKTTSGWADKKFYVLINDVPQSTIVRIESNGRVIYAKVLNNLPEMKENKNIGLRLSAAAASSLGQVNNSFDAEVTYYTN